VSSGPERAVPPTDEPPRTSVVWLVWGLIGIAAVALSLVRAMAVNLPWHLATARLAFETGHWPALNTFSYTFPGYPVFQQYPAFQATVWAVFRAAGWEGLSVLTSVGWVAAFLLFVRWAGTFRQGARFHVLWILALLALQRRMMLRPDMFTMIALGVELLALDGFRRGRTAALAIVPLAHLFWVNSHQLFPVSLLVQGLFLADMAGRRDWRRARLVALALAASVALTFATPLGARIVLAPLRTSQSLAVFRAHVAEFRPVWTMPYELTLALATGIPALWTLWRTRRSAPLFDVGVWLLSLALLASAVRGLMFFGIVSVAVCQRCVLRARAGGVSLLPAIGPGSARILRVLGISFTAMLAGAAVTFRWIKPSVALAGTQPGLGRAVGGWAEAATDFLRANPPPGRMLNLGGALGDDVIFWIPGVPVFVDSRLESYPPDFLREVLAAETDDAALARLIQRYDVSWVFADHTRPARRDRLQGLLRAGWQPVYVDSAHLVVVRPVPATEAYRRQRAIDLAHAQPADLVAAPAALREQQSQNFAAFMSALEQARAR
jgi:hypothetical protein